MSDSDLLTRFVVALEKIAVGINGAKVSVAGAGAGTGAASSDDTAKAAAAAKVATAKAAEAAKAAAAKAAEAAKAGAGKPADKAANKAAASSTPGGTKGAGGKHTLDEIRAIIREVATNAALGKQEALNILDEEGGVKNVADLKADNYDKVYEACQVAISNAGKPEADDPLADL